MVDSTPEDANRFCDPFLVLDTLIYRKLRFEIAVPLSHFEKDLNRNAIAESGLFLEH